MLIYQYYCWEDIPMIEMEDLSSLVTRLVEVAYPEFDRDQITIKWKKMVSFATITWNQDLKDIRIKCSNETKKWHEAAIIGLLAHELSHPAQKGISQSELGTDLDAINRGFGPYLGVERLLAGKYEDHTIRNGKDRYLGYRTIRNQLLDTELKHLDILLTQLRLIPQKMMNEPLVYHDFVIVNSSTNTFIKIYGYNFELPLLEDPNVKFVQKGLSTHVLVNGEDIGIIENEHTNS